MPRIIESSLMVALVFGITRHAAIWWQESHTVPAGAPVLAAVTQDPMLRGMAPVAPPDQYPPKNFSDVPHDA